ncbi:MAG: hypothetical protein OCC49_17970 [Fibrobacterales bacterium]
MALIHYSFIRIWTLLAVLASFLFAQESLISIDDKNIEGQYQKELLYYKTANEFLKSKQYDKALAEFRKIRMTNPLHLKVDESIKECRINLGKWVAPDSETEDVWVEIDPYNLTNLPSEKRDSVYQVSLRLEKEERYRNAQKILSQLVALEPNNNDYKNSYTAITNKIETIKQTLFEIGNEFYKRGLYSQALKEWYKTLFYSPDDNLLLSNIHNAEKKLKELRKYYVHKISILERDNRENELLVLLNNAFHQFPTDSYFKNKFDRIQFTRDSILTIRIDEGQNAFLQGDYDKAEELFSLLFSEYPDNLTIAKWNRSITDAKEKRIKSVKSQSIIQAINNFLIEKRVSEAANKLNQLKKVDRSHSQISVLTHKIASLKRIMATQKSYNKLITLARTSIKSGKFKKALGILHKAKDLQPQNKTTIKLVALVNEKMSMNLSDLNEKISKAKRLFTTNDFSKALATLPSKTGNSEIDNEVRSLTRAIRKAQLKANPPKRIQELFLSGITNYRMGNYKKALKFWLKVLKAEPSHPQARSYVANVKKKIKLMEVK